MAFTFDSTYGGTDSTSYVSIEDCDAYFNLHPEYELWEDLDATDKQRYAIRATTRLDYELYGGSEYLTDQNLQWPRQWIIDRNQHPDGEHTSTGPGGQYYLDPTVFPREMQMATFHLIMFYLEQKDDRYPVTRKEQDTITRSKVGPLDVNIRKANESDLPSDVVRALSALGPNGWAGNKPMKLVR